MTKSFVTIFLALILCGAASAEKIPVEIEGKMLDMLPTLCPSLRASLPSDRRDPWSRPICIVEFARDGMQRLNFKVAVEASRARERKALESARDALRVIPEPTTAPTVGIGTTPEP